MVPGRQSTIDEDHILDSIELKVSSCHRAGRGKWLECVYDTSASLRKVDCRVAVESSYVHNCLALESDFVVRTVKKSADREKPRNIVEFKAVLELDNRRVADTEQVWDNRVPITGRLSHTCSVSATRRLSSSRTALNSTMFRGFSRSALFLTVRTTKSLSRARQLWT